MNLEPIEYAGKDIAIRNPINLSPPICLCGFTADGRMVLGGAFKMGDTNGVPLWHLLDEAEKNGCVISIPHYFASAIESGWDDIQTFKKIRESLVDHGGGKEDMDRIRLECIAMFMSVMKRMPNLTDDESETRAIKVARQMRLEIESDPLAHEIWESKKQASHES